MTEAPQEAVCRNCQRAFPADEGDPFGWCAACRSEVVRRATLVARVIGLAAAGVATWLVFQVARPGPRFLIGWLALIGAVAYAAYKIAQRVVFEVIRARGVPPPES